MEALAKSSSFVKSRASKQRWLLSGEILKTLVKIQEKTVRMQSRLARYGEGWVVRRLDGRVDMKGEEGLRRASVPGNDLYTPVAVVVPWRYVESQGGWGVFKRVEDGIKKVGRYGSGGL